MKFRRFSAFFLALLLAALCALPVGAVAEGCTQETNVTTILFTHDLHSHFLPQPTAEGGESGGYARLKTVIDGERAMNPAALLVDGGDFLHRLPDPDSLYHAGGGAANHGGHGL